MKKITQKYYGVNLLDPKYKERFEIFCAKDDTSAIIYAKTQYDHPLINISELSKDTFSEHRKVI